MPTFPALMTAMATPFNDDGALDLAGAQRLAVHLVDHGSGGLVVAGTTGESPTLSHDETLDLFRAVVEAVEGRAPVLAGTGKNDTASTIGLTREAQKVGVDGILLVTPYYNRPNQAGLDRHFRAVAAATDLPVLLYNIPSRTACEIDPGLLLSLAEDAENVVGVKDAVCDLGKTAWLVARAPEEFGIWCGADEYNLPMLAVGGVGAVSVSAHLVGDQLARMFTVFPTDPAAARDIHLRLMPIHQALFAEPSPGPLKAAMRMVGLDVGEVRLPLVMPVEETEDLIREALDQVGLVQR